MATVSAARAFSDSALHDGVYQGYDLYFEAEPQIYVRLAKISQLPEDMYELKGAEPNAAYLEVRADFQLVQRPIEQVKADPAVTAKKAAATRARKKAEKANTIGRI